MRIGILTLHAQANYGAVLQAYALQSVLTSMGHTVVVIDRWMAPNNGELKGVLASRNIFMWLKFAVRSLLGFGDFDHLIRCCRTMKFIQKTLHLSHYGFYKWEDAPADLGVDVLVVGSDQVWSIGFPDGMTPYLLKDGLSLPAISYAASFGVGKLPARLEDVYKNGLSRFRKISVREKEGAEIVDELGFEAEHVVDPVILADANIWTRFLKPCNKNRRLLVCYFMHDFAGAIITPLKRFAQMVGADVEVFMRGAYTDRPQSVKELLAISSVFFRSVMAPGVRLRTRATPDEFVASIADADWVITDSFHGLMFSAVFGKNVRVLRHEDGRGEASLSRLSEFVDDYVIGNAVFNSEESALQSLLNAPAVSYATNKLEEARLSSLRWLASAMDEVQNHNT